MSNAYDPFKEKKKFKGDGTRIKVLKGKRRLYSVSQGKVYNVGLAVPYYTSCCGSVQGWLVTLDELDKNRLSVNLVNPFRKSVAPIRLPPLDFNSNIYLYEDSFPKVILSGDLIMNISDNNYVAIYVRAHTLSFIEGGQNSWTYMDRLPFSLTDAIFYKGQVYAVGHWGRIFSFTVNTNKPPKAKVLTPPDSPFSRRAYRGYLVESTRGDLLHVPRFLKRKDVKKGRYIVDMVEDLWTDSFKVYKLVFTEEDGSIVERVEVKCIGGEDLFVGDNYSMSILASTFPGCQPNSIYFTDDFVKLGNVRFVNYDGPSDMGTFNLEDETITQHYSLNHWRRNIPASLWIVPPSDL